MATYTPKDKAWLDAKGATVPYARTTALERIQERNAHALLAAARKAEQQLAALKVLVDLKHREVISAVEKAHGVSLKDTKGNKVWYNFDRSIQVECSVQERIDFDTQLIAAARKKLNEFLSNKLSSDDEFIVQMVTTAFETTNGKLDSKRVTHLLSYRSKVKAAKFQSACDLIERSMSRSYSKTYFRIGTLQEDGSYSYVQLNFSAI
jgi:hypothetical protein